MSALNSLFALFLTEEARNKINNKIKEIKISNEWSNFDVGVSLESLDLLRLNYDEVRKEKIIWENIAKLSVNLLNDFEFFSPFVFENRFSAPLYKDLLESLGYVYSDNKWRCIRSPDPSVVQTNVFMYCLYKATFDKMKEKNYSYDYTKSIDCFFCNFEIEKGKSQCDECYSSIEEIILNKNIENRRKERFLSAADIDNNEEVRDNIREVQLKEINKAKSIKNDNVESDECKVLESIVLNNEEDTVFNMNSDIEEFLPKKTLSITGSLTPRSNSKQIYYEESLDNVNNKDDTTDITEDNKEPKGNVESQAVDDKWICAMCTYFNDWKHFTCLACSHDGPHKGKWRCKSCTFINEVDVPKCFVCYMANTNVSVSNGRFINRRNVLNPKLMLNKNMHKSFKDRGLSYPTEIKKDVVNLSQNLWTCIYCDESNDTSSDSCDTCGSER